MNSEAGTVAAYLAAQDTYNGQPLAIDMGKSCLRFQLVSDLPLDVIAKVVARVRPADLIAAHDRAMAGKKRKPAAQKRPVKKRAAKQQVSSG